MVRFDRILRALVVAAIVGNTVYALCELNIQPDNSRMQILLSFLNLTGFCLWLSASILVLVMSAQRHQQVWCIATLFLLLVGIYARYLFALNVADIGGALVVQGGFAWYQVVLEILPLLPMFLALLIYARPRYTKSDSIEVEFGATSLPNPAKNVDDMGSADRLHNDGKPPEI